MKVTRAQRIALGELKNLAGYLMDQHPEQGTLVCALVMRMKEVILKGRETLYEATDSDIQEMLKSAAVIDDAAATAAAAAVGKKPN